MPKERVMHAVDARDLKIIWKHDCYGSGTEEVVLMSVGLRQFDPEQAGQKAIFTKSESAVSFQASEPKVGPGGTTL